MVDKERKRVPVKRAQKEERAIVPRRPEDYLSNIDRAFEDLESRFERMMAQYPGGGGWFAPWRRRWLAEMPEVRHPYADLIDSGKEYRVVAEVPGVPKEKLDITVTDREIRIEGEAKTDVREEKEGFVRRERGYSKISRRISFPEPVVSDKAEASLSNGVLEVKVPKKIPTEVTSHKVTVQ